MFGEPKTLIAHSMREMWRIIAVRNLGQKRLFSQNSSSWVSNFLSRKFPHQNYRFFSQSSMSEVDSEKHEASSSCSKELILEYGGTHVNSDAHMGSIVPIDEQSETLSNVNVTSSVTHIKESKLYRVLDLLKNNVDESLESTLDSMDLCLDEEFVFGLLENTSFPKKHLIRFIKWVSCKKEFRFTTSILGQLGILCRSKHTRIDLYGLWELVKEIGKKEDGLLNSEILNHFLSSFCQLRNKEGALDVFGKFEEFGCIPNGETYTYTIKLLCQQFAYDSTIPICQKMIGMFPEDIRNWEVSEIIDLLCEGDRVKVAHAVYLAAKNDVVRDPEWCIPYSQSKLVWCLSKKDETVHLAQDILGDIPTKEREDFPNSFLSVIRGLCRKKDIGSAKKLLFEMMDKGPPPGCQEFDSVIECLSRAGNSDEALEILNLAQRRGVTPKISSYSAVMNGYAKVGYMEEAYKVLLAAKKKHTKLCHVGLYTLIQGYCKLGEFEKALKVFFEMKNYGVAPNANELNKLTRSLSLCLKNLDRITAQKLLEEMREKGLYLPHITEGLIRAQKLPSV